MKFVDLHSHYLPGIDDGATSLAQSLAMLALAEEQGTQHIVATPHIQPGVYNNSLATIKQAFEQVQVAAQQQGLSIALSMAAEVHLCPEIMLWHGQGVLPLLGTKQSPVLLLELPHNDVPQGVNNLLKWLLQRGITPMIAHPERNRGVQQAPQYLAQWQRMGCLLQLTSSSILGGFRASAQQLAETMLAKGWVDVIASDAHGIDKRSPNLQPAYERVSALQGEAQAQQLLITGPAQLLTGQHKRQQREA